MNGLTEDMWANEAVTSVNSVIFLCVCVLVVVVVVVATVVVPS